MLITTYMPGVFSSKRDRKLFNTLGQEFVNNIVGLFVNYYELVPDTPNVYGEIREKRFYPPKKLRCIIQKQEVETTTEKGLLDIGNNIELYVHHIELKRIQMLPRPGDLISFALFFYEIGNIVNPVIYPLTQGYFSYFKVSAHLVQIEPSSIKIVSENSN